MGLLAIPSHRRRSSSATKSAIEEKELVDHDGDDGPYPSPSANAAPSRIRSNSFAKNESKSERGQLPRRWIPKPKTKSGMFKSFKTGTSKRNLVVALDSSGRHSAIETSSHTNSSLDFQVNDDDVDDHEGDNCKRAPRGDSPSSLASLEAGATVFPRPVERPSLAINDDDCDEDNQDSLSESGEDDTTTGPVDLDFSVPLTGHRARSGRDAMSMLAVLGEFPSEIELGRVAAVRASECIHECIFGDGNDHGGIIDMETWESIPQYSKADLQVQRHLGKGSFSDAFEVSVEVVVQEKELDLSDKDDLERLLEGKFKGNPGVTQKEMDDMDAEIDALFGAPKLKGSTKAPALSEVDGMDEEDDMDAQIDAMFGGGPPSGASSGRHDFCRSAFQMTTAPPPRKQPAGDFAPAAVRRPGRARRATVDHGVSASVCMGNFGSPGAAGLARPVRKERVTYAMKCLRPQIRSDAEQFIVGVEDLVHETAMLAGLDHPHIVRLNGRAASDSFRLSDGYFVLLDRLQDTLEDRVQRWKKATTNPLASQVRAARAIADALAYLHSKDIAFRDLKPANVGFDSAGTLKLFDFGFAVNLKDGDGPLFDVCGTPRYMAPEVGLAQGHGKPADVHSFGILLWEIMALKKPFAKVKSTEEFRKAVFGKGVRPKPSKAWASCVRVIMRQCWSVQPADRPTMAEAERVLGEYLREVTKHPNRWSQGNALKRSMVFRRLTG